MPRSNTAGDSTAIAANGQSLNVFANSAFSNAPYDGFITLLGTGSATGLEVQMMVGTQLAVERQPLNTNNRVPIIPDDVIASDIQMFEGQKLQVSAFNTTAGALTPRIQMRLEEGVRVG